MTHQGGKLPPLVSEREIFKGPFHWRASNCSSSIPPRWNNIPPYLHDLPQTAFGHWSQGSGSGGQQRKRGTALDNTLPTPHTIPNTIDLCRPPTGTPGRSVSRRLNLTLSAIHLFPQGHNVSHKASHLQLPPCPKLPIQVKVHSEGCGAPNKLSKQPSVFGEARSINAPAGGEIPVSEKPLEPI